MEPASIHIAHRIESETPDGSASEGTVGVMSGACPPIFMAGDNAVVTTGAPGKVASADDYYPFGMVMEGRSFNYGQADARYKFTSKERDTETGYDYFGARYYDARIARWLSVDPLAGKYPGWSPFTFTLNNPLRYVDPNGLDVFVAISGWGQSASGSQGASETTRDIINSAEQVAKVNGIEFNAQGYLASPSGSEVEDAILFISKYRSDGEKVIIYGYSMGGVSAMELATRLGENGITVNLLVTVDASKGYLGTAASSVSGNVEVNENHFQREESFLGSRGQPNKAVSPKTDVQNRMRTGTTHADIDELVKDEVINSITNTIKRKIHYEKNGTYRPGNGRTVQYIDGVRAEF